MKRILFIVFFLLIYLYISSQYISEVYYDTPITGDEGAFVELKGIPGTALDSFIIYGVNGSDGTVYNTIALTGCTIPSDSYFVIAADSTVNNWDIIDANVDYQNGPDNIVLENLSMGVVDAVGYGDFSSSVFAGFGLPTYDVYTNVLSRLMYVNNNYYDYMGFKNPTPGMGPYTPIPLGIVSIQNSIGDSPYLDSTVITSGVITAIFNDAYYIQDGQGAFQGVEVWDIKADSYAIGDSISVSGMVYESYGKTVVEFGVSTLQASGLTPFAVELLLTDIGEPFEGQFINVKRVYVANDSLGYGEWLVKDDNGDSLIIDDRSGNYTTPVTGTKIYSITGVLDYSYGNYKLQPRDSFDIVLGYLFNGQIGLSDNPADSSGTIIQIVEMSLADTTDSSGNYAMDYVPAGTYTVISSHTGYYSDTSIITVDSNYTFNTILQKITYRIYGKVGLSDNPADSSGTIVEIPSLALIDTTDAGGNYEFIGIDNGIYTVYYTHTGYESDSAIVTVVDADVEQNMLLNLISGIDDNRGLPIVSSFNVSNGKVSFVYNKTDDNTSSIEIYDLTGRTISSLSFTNKGIYNVSINKVLPVGLYFLSINESHNNTVKKFIVVK